MLQLSFKPSFFIGINNIVTYQPHQHSLINIQRVQFNTVCLLHSEYQERLILWPGAVTALLLWPTLPSCIDFNGSISLAHELFFRY